MCNWIISISSASLKHDGAHYFVNEKDFCRPVLLGAFGPPFSPFLGIENALNASITGLDSLAIIRLPKTWICYWFCPAHWTWEWTWPPVHGDDAKAWRQRRHWSPERDIGLWRIDIVINIIGALFICAPLRFPRLSSSQVQDVVLSLQRGYPFFFHHQTRWYRLETIPVVMGRR